MTVKEYRNDLEGKSVKALRALFEKVFGEAPKSRAKKAELVDELVAKYEEVRSAAKGEEQVETEAAADAAEEAAQEEAADAAPKPKSRGSREGSRRGTIIEEVQFGIWDSGTLAEALNIVNSGWPVAKNKSAVAGTLADMRKNKGWTVRHSDDVRDKGRICVTVPE